MGENSNDILKVLTFKWRYMSGIKLPSRIKEYTAEHVNRLYHSVERNLTLPHEFICITDDPTNIECRTLPLWETYRHLGGCFCRLLLFHPEMKEYIGKRFAVIDLDSVIVGSLNEMFSRTEDFIMNQYQIIHAISFNEQFYNGGLWLMNAGCRPHVLDTFTENGSMEILEQKRREKKLVGTDQAWISFLLVDSEAVFNKKDGVYEYRYLADGKLPEDARLVLFAGKYDPSILVDKIDWIKENWI